MICLGDTTIVLFTLVVLCVGALAAGFIADGWGKFRAPHREAEEQFDRDALAREFVADGLRRFDQQAMANMRRKGFYVVPDSTPHLREIPPPSRLYDQEVDGYI